MFRTTVGDCTLSHTASGNMEVIGYCKTCSPKSRLENRQQSWYNVS